MSWPFLVFSLVLSSIVGAGHGKLVNTTIDDTAGPRAGQAQIVYRPLDGWRDGATCQDCVARPDASQFQGGTWHESLYDPATSSNAPSALVTFEGTAVYVTCALAKSKTAPFGDSNFSFFLDGTSVGTFVRAAPGLNGYDYNVVVYSNQTLNPGSHTLTIENGMRGGGRSLMLLDSVTYSYDDGEPEDSTQISTPQPPIPTPLPASRPTISKNAIIGMAVGFSVAVLLVICLAFLLLRKREKTQEAHKSFFPHPQSYYQPSSAFGSPRQGVQSFTTVAFSTMPATTFGSVRSFSGVQSYDSNAVDSNPAPRIQPMRLDKEIY